MLSAVRRYKLLLSESLARYFPRTTAYLREQNEAAQPPTAKKPRATARKQDGAAAKPRAPRKPKAEAGEKASAKPAVEGPAGIYPARVLAVRPEQVEAMRERVRQAVSAGVVSPPSDEQWAMILCRQPLARIFAGAGSGKSTTLVLRLVFMLCHLGIEADKVTVISFTNASCAQLREQLVRVLAFWQYPFDMARARECVRTFHSAMGVQARELLGKQRWFEQLEERNPDEPDNPLTGGRLRPAQQRLLLEAYEECYAVNGAFRAKVHRLLGLEKPEEVPGPAPVQPFRLPGEFVEAPLVEVFHTQAGFMESLGLRPQDLIERVIGLEEAAAALPAFDRASPAGITVIDPRLPPG